MESSEKTKAVQKEKERRPPKKAVRYFDSDKKQSSNDKDPAKKKRKDPSEPRVVDLSDTNLLGRQQNKRFIKKDGLRFNKHHDRKSRFKPGNQRHDPFPGPAPISKDKIKKYKRGHKVDIKNLRDHSKSHQVIKKEKEISFSVKQSARSEILNTEDAGFIEAEEGDTTTTSTITQHEIARAVDIASAQKFFELKLDKFGPYSMNYTRNGRHLLIGGGRGHIAAIDWQTKKLHCEINVMETVNDVKWLHIETMFAVAQKQWTYVYDNQGLELHCIKTMDQTLRMEFLPYHFLLVAGNSNGYLTYIDVSIGQKVVSFPTYQGRLDVMCQNPANAIIHAGHPNGTVTLWSPNVRKDLVKMLCHGGGVRSVAVNTAGTYMATSGVDRKLKIWDMRMYKELHSYRIGAGAGQMAFSQRGLLSMSMGNVVEVYQDPCKEPVTSPYLTYRCSSAVRSVQFCPYEDVLGVGHVNGFSSLLVPGAGEPNFDALEANPFQSKKQRQQAEVKMLLEKVPADLISLDTKKLGQVDVITLQKSLDDMVALKYLKVPKVDFAPKKTKQKGRSKTGKLQQRKQGVLTERTLSTVRADKLRKKLARPGKGDTSIEKKPAEYSVFNRFKKKDV